MTTEKVNGVLNVNPEEATRIKPFGLDMEVLLSSEATQAASQWKFA